MLLKNNSNPNICWYCNEAINELNDSDEHIIPESLGGKIHSYGLLHRTCNNKLGGQVDKSISEQLGFLAFMADVKNRKNKNRVYYMNASDGKKYAMTDRRTLKHSAEILLPNNKTITLTAKDQNELLFKLHTKLDLLCKGGHYNKEKTLESIKGNKEGDIIVYFTNGLDPQDLRSSKIGGFDLQQAISKIAVNFAVLSGLLNSFLHEIVRFIKSEKDEDIIGKQRVFCRPHYPSYLPPYYPKEQEISHVISIHADPFFSKALIYIELFNVECYFVMVSYNYQGPYIQKTIKQSLSGEITETQTSWPTRPMPFYYAYEFSPYHHSELNQRIINCQKTIRFKRFERLTILNDPSIRAIELEQNDRDVLNDC